VPDLAPFPVSFVLTLTPFSPPPGHRPAVLSRNAAVLQPRPGGAGAVPPTGHGMCTSLPGWASKYPQSLIGYFYPIITGLSPPTGRVSAAASKDSARGGPGPGAGPGSGSGSGSSRSGV
jgi:hypothetical protein